MLLEDFFYGLALLLTIFIIIDIVGTGTVKVPDIIAALSAILLIVLALYSPSSSSKKSFENPVRDTTEIAGNWEGTLIGDTSDFSSELTISIQTGCSTGNICGTFSIPKTSCSGNLKLEKISYMTFYFLEDSCGHGSAQITLFSNGKLSWTYQDGSTKSHATLSRK